MRPTALPEPTACRHGSLSSLLRAGALAVGVVLLAQAADAVTLCVRPGGGEGCIATIGEALAAADPGDTIRVAQGDYAENVVITESVVLEGGWSSDFTERDPAIRVSRITPADPSTSVVSILGSFADPATVAPVLDGFTIEGGRADQGFNHGGGVRVIDSEAVLRDNVVRDNDAFLLGGGLWVQRGAPRIEGNRIEANRALDENGDAAGGGVMLENTRARLVGNVISTNSSQGLGGGVGVVGGAPVLADNQVLENQAPGGGAGISAQASADLLLRGGLVRRNGGSLCNSGPGAGLHARGSTVRVESTRFEANCVVQVNQTTGLVFSESPFALRSVSVSGHFTALASLTEQPGAVAADDASPGEIVNVTLASNEGTAIRTASDLLLRNAIVMGHDLGLDVDASADVEVVSSAFFENDADETECSCGPRLCTCVIDPVANFFVDPELDADLRLSATSPLLDVGTRDHLPAHDFDGEPRVMAGPSQRFRVDVGADEFSGPAQRTADVGADGADLTLIGPGQPPENPDSAGPNDWMGYAVLVEDLTGDGEPEFLIAAQDLAVDFDTLNATGRVFGLLPFAKRRTGTRDLLEEPADFELVSRIENQHLGEQLLAADLDADGVRDLVAGSTQNDADPDVIPTVFVFRGGASLTDGRVVDEDTTADFEIRAPGDSLAFSALNGVAVGDLDGDGTADLAVGDGLTDDGANQDAGAVFVVFGGAGLTGVLDLSAEPADFTLFGPAAGASLQALALGDLDADGFRDLVARTETTAHAVLGPIAPGSHRLAETAADVILDGLEGSLGNERIFVFDLTGDGRDDLLASSDDDLLVFAGPFVTGTVLDAADATLVFPDLRPWSFATGDWVGDPRPDLIVGSRDRREAFVLASGLDLSGSIPIEEVASQIVAGASVNNLGWSTTTGDLDADGRADLVVGSWQENVPGHGPDMDFEDAGVTHVLYGRPLHSACVDVPGPPAPDADTDGVPDPCDNCAGVANGPAVPDAGGDVQRDADQDGFGNACDPDLDGNGVVDFLDLALLRAAFGGEDPVSDLDGSGAVDAPDLSRTKALFFGPPGPAFVVP